MESGPMASEVAAAMAAAMAWEEEAGAEKAWEAEVGEEEAARCFSYWLAPRSQ